MYNLLRYLLETARNRSQNGFGVSLPWYCKYVFGGGEECFGGLKGVRCQRRRRGARGGRFARDGHHGLPRGVATGRGRAYKGRLACAAGAARETAESSEGISRPTTATKPTQPTATATKPPAATTERAPTEPAPEPGPESAAAAPSGRERVHRCGCGGGIGVDRFLRGLARLCVLALHGVRARGAHHSLQDGYSVGVRLGLRRRRMGRGMG